jgi:hypothetical protein
LVQVLLVWGQPEAVPAVLVAAGVALEPIQVPAVLVGFHPVSFLITFFSKSILDHIFWIFLIFSINLEISWLE